MHYHKFTSIVWTLLAALLLGAGVALAGGPDSTTGPDATLSFNLEDLYRRLNNGTPGSRQPFTEPDTPPGTGTMHTLDEIMAVAPALDDAAGATPGQVLSGTTYWGLRSDGWGPQTGTAVLAAGSATDAQVLSGVTYSNSSGSGTGTMPNNGAGGTITPTTTSQSIAAGYWSSANTVLGDPDLVAGNIVSGTTIFGVTGSMPLSIIPRTGITATGAVMDDGFTQMGVAWPNPRFIDHGSLGTVTDALTGRKWLKDAGCWGTTTKWYYAVDWPRGLRDPNCGLNDGSILSWQLPNVREMLSLLDYAYNNPALSNTAGDGQWTDGDPFTNVRSGCYWTSSYIKIGGTAYAYAVNLGDGTVQLLETVPTGPGPACSVMAISRFYNW